MCGAARGPARVRSGQTRQKPGASRSRSTRQMLDPQRRPHPRQIPLLKHRVRQTQQLMRKGVGVWGGGISGVK